MKNLVLIILLFNSYSCKKENEPSSDAYTNTHIEYYGFTIIDTYWDDPSDAEQKMNYADEIHGFSNLADLLVVDPNDALMERVHYFQDLELKAILHLNELFFELVDNNSPSGSNYDLRANFQERWTEFKGVNQSILNHDFIGAFYIGEEPTWNGISFDEMDAVSQLLQMDFPNIPTMMIEAYPALDDLQVPQSVDWVGFDRYFIKNPNTDTEFQQDWTLLKSKLSNQDQRIMVIMDSHYIDWVHGDFGNIDVEEMDEVAKNYYELAQRDDKVIGILGYFWPSGFDVPESLGARGMPADVKRTYERIGKEITGKTN